MDESAPPVGVSMGRKIAPATAKRTSRIKPISGQVHGLRFFCWRRGVSSGSSLSRSSSVQFRSAPRPAAAAAPAPAPATAGNWEVPALTAWVGAVPVVGTGAVIKPVLPSPSNSSMPGTAASAARMSPARIASAASASFSAVAGRSAGSLASIDISSARTGRGSDSGSGGGVSLICAMAMATCDSPVNGRRPARHS